MSKEIINITYDPYEQIGEIKNNSKCYDKDNELRGIFDAIIKKIYINFDNLIQGKNEIECIFTGREYEFIKLIEYFKFEYQDSKKKIIYKHIKKFEYDFGYIKSSFNKLPKNIFKNEAKKKIIDSELNSTVKIYVTGLYSSGKSTFLNALIGEDILFSSNNVATNKIVSILNNDEKKNYSLEITKNNKSIDRKIYNDVESIKQDIEKYNSSKLVDTMKIELNYKNLFNSNFKVELIDTPGTNNANNKTHQTLIYEELNKKDNINPIIIVINALSFHATDQHEQLDKLLENIKDLNNVFFIVNRADSVENNEYEKDYLSIKSYIIDKLGEGIKIYSLTSKFALKLRQENPLKSKETRRFVEDIIEPDEKIIDFLPKYSSRGDFIDEIKINHDDSDSVIIEKALVYTGITTIEKDLNDYIENQAIIYKLKYCFEHLNEIKDSFNIKVDELKKKFDNLKNEILDYESNIENKKNDKQRIETEISKLSKEIENNKKNIQDLEMFIKNINIDINDYKKNLPIVEFNLPNYNRENSELSKLVSDLTKQYNDKKFSEEEIKKVEEIINNKIYEKQNKTKQAFFSDINSFIEKESENIISKFSEIINKHKSLLENQNEQYLLTDILIKMDDIEITKQTYTNTDEVKFYDFITFGISRLIRDTSIIDTNKIKETINNFKNKIDNYKNNYLKEFEQKRENIIYNNIYVIENNIRKREEELKNINIKNEQYLKSFSENQIEKDKIVKALQEINKLYISKEKDYNTIKNEITNLEKIIENINKMIGIENEK